MLSDEEREALRNFKSEYETCDHYSSDLIIELDDAEILLNLIDKQSKEIEELNKSDASKEQSSMKYYNLYKELVDKIKAKIEPLLKQLDTKMKEEYNKYGNSREYQDIIDDYNFLQSLLEKE